MMKSSLGSLSLLAGLASLGLTACGDEPPAPAEVRSRISTDLPRILGEMRAALEGGTAALPGGAAFGALDRALGASGIDTAARVRTAIADFTARGGGLRPEDPTAQDEEVAFLIEEVFTDENHAGEGVYRLPAALACTETELDGNGQYVEVVDPACAAEWDRAEIRIRVSAGDDELRFALQLGPDRDEPLALGLERDALSLSVDLDEALRAAASLAPLFGGALPNIALSGQITGRLEVAGPAHAIATLSIDRALSIKAAPEGASLDGPDAFRFASAKARVLELDLDGAAGRGSAELGLGATTAHVVEDTGTGTERVELDLPGVTGRATFGADGKLELTNVSLGGRTTTVSRNGVVGARYDLNPDDGRAFGATITTDGAGRETITVTPKFDLRAAVDHAVLGELEPVYDMTQLLLDGSLRSDEVTERLEVLTGSFRMTTDPAGYGFTAVAGQCVRGTDLLDQNGHTYTMWTVSACP